MFIKSLSISGFLGASQASPLRLDDCARINLLIGPNNSGKSILFRFAYIFRDFLHRTWGTAEQISADDFPERYFWRHDSASDITVDAILLTNTEALNSGGLVIISDFEMRLRLTVVWNVSSARIRSLPFVVCEGQWEFPSYDTGKSTIELKNGHSYHMPAIDNPELKGALASLPKSMRIFDTIRALDRGGPRPNDDGSNILASLYSLQDKANTKRTYHQFETKLIGLLNEILVPAGSPAVARISLGSGSPRPQLFLHFVNSPEDALDVSQMGSGISQMIIVLSTLLRDPAGVDVIFLEEPETNLHPAVLRRFITVLRREAKGQLFISSHSHILLDTLGAGDQLFHFEQDAATGACKATPCRKFIERHGLLDSLGVTGSTLLQCNSVLWVEGPSDRLYIRKWLDLHCESVGCPQLIEGSDYSFAFYGGSVLSHFGFAENEEATRDAVAMLSIGRFSAVVMDRDLPPGANDDALIERKRRQLTDALHDETHRLAIVTTNREIENDLPIELLRATVAHLAKFSVEAVNGIKVEQQQSYSREFANGLASGETERKKIARKLAQKTILAQAALKLSEEQGITMLPPEYIVTIAEFIIRSRLETATATS